MAQYAAAVDQGTTSTRFLLFDRQVFAPEIAVELIGGGLFGPVDDPELHVDRLVGVRARQFEEAEAHRFEQALFTPMFVVALLDISSET